MRHKLSIEQFHFQFEAEIHRVVQLRERRRSYLGRVQRAGIEYVVDIEGCRQVLPDLL